MLTGRPAFEDEDVSMTLSKVLQREPDFDTLPRSVPPPVRQALRLCLRKHLKQRISDIRDLRLALDGAFETTAPPTPATASRLAWMAAFAVVVVVVVAMAVPLVRHLREPAPPVTHLEMGVLPAERLVLSNVSVRPSRTALAISPDGRRVVFNAMRGTAAQLYIRGLDQAEAQPISGTEGARGPFLSPDGVWIGFWADNQIKKVPIAGGPIAPISDAPAGNGGLLGASWGDDGTIVFATAAGISKVSSDAGPPALIIKIKANASTGERLLLPHLLPGGKSLLFTAVAATDWETANVVVYSLDTGERRVLIPGGADARYVSTGHLVYMKTGTLMAVPFDTRSQQLTGTPVALVEGVMHAVSMPNIADETGAGQFTVSTSGTLLYVVGGISPGPATTGSTRRPGRPPVTRSPLCSLMKSVEATKSGCFPATATANHGCFWNPVSL